MTGKPNLYALVGMKHRGTEALVLSLPPDAPLVLIRDPANKYDPNAIQVWARGRHVGYISKNQNAVLARFIDEHGERTARMGMDTSDGTVEASGKAVSARLHLGSNTYPLVYVG